VGATTELEYPDIAELNDHQRLADEKAYLGFYVSGHPLAEFSREIAKLSTWTAADIAELGPDKKVEVRIVGIITGVRKRKTQRGEMMADVTIEDLTGEVVGIIFARDLETYLDQLFEGNVVAVEGSAGLGRDKPEILLSSLKPLKRAWQENVKTIHVNVMSEGLEEELLQNLKKTFLRHPGKAGLVFHLKTPRHGEIVIRTGEEFLVAPTPEMEVQVEDLLDDGVVDYEVREYQPTGHGNGKNGYRMRKDGGNDY
jgi:DNA polymerase-3 subunit alpha